MTRFTTRAFALAASAVAWLLMLHPALGSASPARHSAGHGCDKAASPSGSDDTGSGSLRRPFRTLTRLDRSLDPGQVGCLLSGTYGSVDAVHQILTDGQPASRITIEPYPGQHVKLIGLVRLEGSYTTLSGFEIDGSNDLYTTRRSGTSCPSPVSGGLDIDGTGDIFEHNDYYQSISGLRGNGIGIGWNHSPAGVIIRYNRIHDVGQCMAYDQIIYLATGNGTQIYDNWLWDDGHGWGIQIYPSASRSQIWANVIDQAGSGFGIGGDSATSDNRIVHNVIMDSTGLPEAGDGSGVAISDWWSGTPGSGNVFMANDSYRNRRALALVTGVKTSHNIKADPRLLNPAAHDYRPGPRSPVAHWELWNGDL